MSRNIHLILLVLIDVSFLLIGCHGSPSSAFLSAARRSRNAASTSTTTTTVSPAATATVAVVESIAVSSTVSSTTVDEQQEKQQILSSSYHSDAISLNDANNTVVTSSEVQGATSKTEKDVFNSTNKSTDSATPTEEASVKVATSEDTLKSGSKSPQRDQANVSSPPNESSSHTSITTTRSPRNTLAAQRKGDNRLMDLLAARRSALQRDRWRTHRRGGSSSITTNRTILIDSTTSIRGAIPGRNSSDARTICERNCTKNFTRRTTASCMRRCVSLHRNSANAVTSSSFTPSFSTTSSSPPLLLIRNNTDTIRDNITNAVVQKLPSIRTKVDEKDNNEILLPDESSHGVYVVTKEINDTINHISGGRNKSSVLMTSTEKNYKIKLRPRQPYNSSSTSSVEEVDLKPYLYFGQKLPPLKPTVLRITKINNENPKILEVSVTKPTERVKIRNRINPRERNIVAATRRQGYGNFTRSSFASSTTTTTAPISIVKTATSSTSSTSSPTSINHEEATSTEGPIGLFRHSSEERLIKEAILEDDSTVTLLVRSPQRHSAAKLQLSPLINGSNSSLRRENRNVSSQIFSPVTIVLENGASTPLFINVPEAESITEQTSDNFQTPVIAASDTQDSVTTPSGTYETFSSKNVDDSNNTSSSIITNRATSFLQSSEVVTTTVSSIIPSKSTIEVFSNPSFGFMLSSSSVIPPIINLDNYETTLSTTEKPETKTTISSSIRSTISPVQEEHSSFRPSSIPEIVLKGVESSAEVEHSREYFYNSTRHNGESDNFSNVTTLDFLLPQQNNKTSQNHTMPSITTPTAISSTNKYSGIEPNLSGAKENDIDNEKERINMATYVMAALGMLPVIVIIIYVVRSFLYKKGFKIHDDDMDNFTTTDQQPISPVRKMDQCEEDERTDQYSTLSDPLEFERNNLRFKSLLGEGNFGQVWKAEADDLNCHRGTTRIVAVKIVRAGSSQSGLKEEAEIMKKLGSHPNVVTLLGACLENEPHLLIMEYAMRGRLLSLLRAARSATNILPASVPGGRSLAPLSPRTLAGFALDIARGMEYISGKKIVHRDLAARNVLLDHNGVCKICDFGMSIDLEKSQSGDSHQDREESKRADARQFRGLEGKFNFDIGGRLMNHWSCGLKQLSNHNSNNNNSNVGAINSNNNNNHDKKHHHDSVSRRPALPIRWMAPEALQYHIFTTETDVWAFGIVLWEVATLGCTPYPNLSGREVVRCVPNGVRPELPKEGRPEFYELMSRCWRKEPRQRPTFREARIEISRTICKWADDDTAASDYMDVSGFSEDLEHGMVYFNRRISEFECEI